MKTPILLNVPTMNTTAIFSAAVSTDPRNSDNDHSRGADCVGDMGEEIHRELTTRRQQLGRDTAVPELHITLRVVVKLPNIYSAKFLY
jgi:hypothetical protein